jgi:hypothetical protein
MPLSLFSARSSSYFLLVSLLRSSPSSSLSCFTVSSISCIFFSWLCMMLPIHFSMYACSVFVSRFLEIESRNSRALSLESFNSFSWPRRSYSLAPDSVISVASYLAAFKLWSFELTLKSIRAVWWESSSSRIFSELYIALYIIVAILSISLTAYPEAS